MNVDSIDKRIAEAVLSYRGIPLDLAIDLARARIAVTIAESSMDTGATAKRAELALLEIRAGYDWLKKTASPPG